MKADQTLTHAQVRRALLAGSDRQNATQLQPAVEKHLAGCPDCQAYRHSLENLESRLADELPAAWPLRQPDERRIASTLAEIQHTRRKPSMKSLFTSTLRSLAFGVLSLALIGGMVWAIRTLLPNPPQPTLEPAQGNQATLPSAAETPLPAQTGEPTPPPPPEAQPVAIQGLAGLFPTTLFDLPGGFPASPPAVNLYRLLLPEAVSAESARQMAASLGLTGAVYAIPGEGFDQVIYEVSDGFSVLRFINFAEQFVYEGSALSPLYSGEALLPYEEQLRIAVDYLTTRGLLDQPYRAQASPIQQGVVVFTPLLEDRPLIYGNGQNPGNLEWISVQVNAEGQVSSMMVSRQRFEAIGEYPILTAEQAWARLSAPNASTRSQFAVLAADQPNTYHVWRRPYPQSQPVDLFGRIQVRQPLDPADPLWVSFNNYPVAGGEGLAALQSGTFIHAWGQFIPDESGRLVFQLDDWEVANLNEQYYEGHIQRQEGQSWLQALSGERYLLPDLPADVPDELWASVTGLLLPGEPAVLNWFTIAGGEYPETYHTSRSCGGGGGGGGGGPANVNFGSGSFGALNLDGSPPPIPTSQADPGQVIQALTGQVHVINHLTGGGNSVLEVTVYLDPDQAWFPEGTFAVRLEGQALQGIQQYQNLQLRIWGQVTGEQDGTPIITVERYEPLYPGVQIQQWNGTEAILNLEGQDVVLLTDTQGASYVLQSSLTWGAQGNVVGVLGDLIEIEGYLLPDQQFGGYPVIKDLSGGAPPDGEITSDDVDQYDHTSDILDVGSLMQGQVTIDSIELAYASITLENCLSSHATDANIQPFLTVQPVWVFSGHFRDGRLVVIQVQALPDAYLK